MFTQDRIEQVRRQTSISMMDAIHALTLAGGDVDRAIDGLNDHAHAGNHAIIAASHGHARRIAAAPADSATWFECETTPGGTRALLRCARLIGTPARAQPGAARQDARRSLTQAERAASDRQQRVERVTQFVGTERFVKEGIGPQGFVVEFDLLGERSG